MDLNFTIAHIHVWDQNNKGDKAIVDAVQELLKQQFKGVKIIDFPVDILKSSNQKTIDYINKADLVVIGGGGIFYHWFSPYDINVIKAIKKPIIIFGVGYIREEGARKLVEKEKESIAFLCKQAKLIGVRDYYTKNFLVKMGLSKNSINIIGDPAIFLSEKVTNKLKLKSKINIGLNINYSGWLGFGKYQDKILNSYIEVADYFKKVYNADIYYAQHHPGEEAIKKQLAIKNLRTINLPPREQKFIYSQLDILIGMMLHSCVMAFGAGTPEINIAYDIRNKNFAKFINHPELVIVPSKLAPGILLKKVIHVFEYRQQYRLKFKARKKKIWNNHSNFLSSIEKLIKQKK